MFISLFYTLLNISSTEHFLLIISVAKYDTRRTSIFFDGEYYVYDIQYIVHNFHSSIRPDRVAQLEHGSIVIRRSRVRNPAARRAEFLLARGLEIMKYLTREHFLLIILPNEQ